MIIGYKKYIKYTLIAFIAFWIYLIVSGNRVLVNQIEITEVDDKGVLFISKLDCVYFTGRSFITAGYWYSANDFMGISECPFIRKP